MAQAEVPTEKPSHDTYQATSAETQVRRSEEATFRLGIQEPTQRDIDITKIMRDQSSGAYVPERTGLDRGLPDHVLKASEAIQQLPILCATAQVCETHSTFHEGQGIEDINCAFCRESIRDRIRLETERLAKEACLSPEEVSVIRNNSRGKHAIGLDYNKKYLYLGTLPVELGAVARWYASTRLSGTHRYKKPENVSDADVRAVKSIVNFQLGKKGLI